MWHNLDKKSQAKLVQTVADNLEQRLNLGNKRYHSEVAGFQGCPLEHALEEAYDSIIYLEIAMRREIEIGYCSYHQPETETVPELPAEVNTALTYSWIDKFRGSVPLSMLSDSQIQDLKTIFQLTPDITVPTPRPERHPQWSDESRVEQLSDGPFSKIGVVDRIKFADQLRNRFSKGDK